MPSLRRPAPPLLQAVASIAAACLVGCAHAPTQSSAETASLQRSSTTTSIVDFVSKAEVGQTSQVDQVGVQVINAYAAASGRTCRQYVVTQAGGKSQQHLACSSEQGWVEVRPLILGDGAGREPRGP